MTEVNMGLTYNSDLKTPSSSMEVLQPKITVLNNIFPPYEELRNCRTCHKGRRLPADMIDTEYYHYHCTLGVDGGHEHIGARCLDNACEYYIRRRD